ncbi:MAG: multidrug effflux MFS transporter [Granulosicoccus sp.]
MISRSLLLLLIGISAIGPLALNGVLPANSAIMDELATRYGLAQLVLTVFLLASLISQLFLGPAADRHGRRPVMLASLAVFTVGSLLCAVAPSIEWLLAARFMQGFGSAVCVFLPRTIVHDIFPRDRAASVIGYMTTAMMLAPMFGPAVGGWVTDELSWRYMYAGLALLGTGFILLSWRYQPETQAVRSSHAAVDSSIRPTLWSAASVLLRQRMFIAYAIMLSGAVGVYYNFLAGAPYVAMESRGLSASSYGAWFSMVAIGYLLGNLIAGHYSARIGVRRMIQLGLIPLFLGVALFWVFSNWHHPLALFIPMQIVAVSNGMSLPNLISGAMSVRPDLAASASGLAGSLQTAVGVLLSIAVGYLLPFSDNWLFVLASLSLGLSLFGYWLASDNPESTATRH